MRRRSERKKSTDVSSPPSRRTSRRSRKSPSFSETEKVEKPVEAQPEKELTTEVDGNASSEDHVETTRRGRSTRNRTPILERSSPAKRRNLRAPSGEVKINAIPEEENGTVNSKADEENEQPEVNTTISKDPIKKRRKQLEQTTDVDRQEEKEDSGEQVVVVQEKDMDSKTEVIAESPSFSPKTSVDDNLKTSDVKIHSDPLTEDTTQSMDTSDDKEELTNSNSDGQKDEILVAKDEESNDEPKELQENTNVESDNVQSPENIEQLKEKSSETQKQHENNISGNFVEKTRTRKRRWLSKRTVDSKAPILAISTDSLKNLIDEVHPVPLSDVQLESSSDVEEVVSEREEGEETPSPRRRTTPEKTEKTPTVAKRKHSDALSVGPGHGVNANLSEQRSPSPARNQASNVLFITNLVRPFTVLQLKGLLARTGKIVDDGFWIDRIKSKCYVQYETEDEAIETRHALHGVRWPVSNPKCLNVDFGVKADMERAIQSTKDDTPKFEQEHSKENLVVGTGWNRERNEIDDKKNMRPVREWDVGKKESLDRDKLREKEKRRGEGERSREREIAQKHDAERNGRDRKPRSKGRDPRSSSLSPVRKIKKRENDPPLRLLDDLFRKTKATPCIYWLPLTPEQIAEKEAFRQKRIEEHKERIKQRELERGKERERERERNRDSERERNRIQRRNRSSDDHRRSRSRERRRY